MHDNTYNSFGNSRFLSNDLFILPLRRFIARHGNVKNIRSDNGANFVGAEKELKAAANEIDQEKVMTEIKKRDVHCSWNFNPPMDARSLVVVNKVS